MNELFLEYHPHSYTLGVSLNGVSEVLYLGKPHDFKGLNLFIIENYICQNQRVSPGSFLLRMGVNKLNDLKEILYKRLKDKKIKTKLGSELDGLTLESIIANEKTGSLMLSGLFNYEIIEDKYPEYYI